MQSQIYNQPKYYEIAFSFVDPEKQVKLFEKFIKKYSKIKVKKVLDIACGPALQLREFSRKKYISVGIDSNPQMINYLNDISSKEAKINVIKANMNKFRLKDKVDFSYIMMGSIIYAKNNEMFLSHLNSVADSLKSGGLYLIENMAMNWSDPKFLKSQSWVMKKRALELKRLIKLPRKTRFNKLFRKILFLMLTITERGENLLIKPI
jgi:SAM-dependent methyltransferase